VRDQAIRVHPELSPAAYNVLATLVRCGPQHAGSLAAMLYTDKSTISRIVKQLGELDLVERRPDPADGRACILAATEDATSRVDAVRDGQRQQLRQFLDGWVVADIHQLTSLLSRLNAEA
jgi:DNA-binding MarR family transcriptional regulator